MAKVSGHEIIKREIARLKAKIDKEGKTDPIENELDALENKIGQLKNKTAQKELKDLLGQVK